jgi:hypothetical protein
MPIRSARRKEVGKVEPRATLASALRVPITAITQSCTVAWRAILLLESCILRCGRTGDVLLLAGLRVIDIA